MILFGALAILLLSLPVCALPNESSTRVGTDDTAQTSELLPGGEETLREGSPVTEGSLDLEPQGLLGQSGGWIAIALCILMVISLLLIIVAMIPGKRK